MDISIIIGLLIALVIVCATTVVNNLINKGYNRLKKQFDDRKNCINSINKGLGNLKEYYKKLETQQDKLGNSACYLKYMGSTIDFLADKLDLYESRYY